MYDMMISNSVTDFFFAIVSHLQCKVTECLTIINKR